MKKFNSRIPYKANSKYNLDTVQVVYEFKKINWLIDIDFRWSVYAFKKRAMVRRINQAIKYIQNTPIKILRKEFKTTDK